MDNLNNGIPTGFDSQTGKWKHALMLFAFLLGLQPVIAASFTLDFSAINNKNARVYGPGGVDITFNSPDITSVSITSAGTYSVEINPGDNITAYLQLIIGAKGAISSVKWKDEDGSQTSGQFVNLPAQFYTLGNKSKSLTLTGISAIIDVQSIDLSQFMFPQAGVPVPDPSTGNYNYTLFPGDYVLILGNDEVGAGLARVELELEADKEEWSDSLLWKPYHVPGNQPGYSALPAAYFVVSGASLELKGQTIQLSVEVNNTTMRFAQTGGYLNNNLTLHLFPGTYNLKSGVTPPFSADFTMILDANTAAFQDTVWMTDSDSSMSGEGIVLNSGIIFGDGDSLHIKGQAVSLRLQLMDISTIILGLSGTPDENGWRNIKILPGDYGIEINGQAGQIIAELQANGAWSARPYILNQGEVASSLNYLHGRTFTRTSDSLDIHGMLISFDMQAISEYVFTLENLDGQSGVILEGDTGALRLLPGIYTMTARQTVGGDPEMEIRMTFDNRNGGILSKVEWKDLLGNTTQGNFVQYPPQNVWARRGKVIFNHLPSHEGTEVNAVYAVPERKPSGAFYQLDGAFLRFKYAGEYDPGLLQAQVLDWHRSVILSPVVLSLQKDYGDNRFSINCGSLSQGHYTLEITNEKNETFYVRFQKK